MQEASAAERIASILSNVSLQMQKAAVDIRNVGKEAVEEAVEKKSAVKIEEMDIDESPTDRYIREERQKPRSIQLKRMDNFNRAARISHVPMSTYMAKFVSVSDSVRKQSRKSGADQKLTSISVHKSAICGLPDCPKDANGKDSTYVVILPNSDPHPAVAKFVDTFLDVQADGMCDDRHWLCKVQQLAQCFVAWLYKLGREALVAEVLGFPLGTKSMNVQDLSKFAKPMIWSAVPILVNKCGNLELGNTNCPNLRQFLYKQTDVAKPTTFIHSVYAAVGVRILPSSLPIEPIWLGRSLPPALPECKRIDRPWSPPNPSIADEDEDEEDDDDEDVDDDDGNEDEVEIIAVAAEPASGAGAPLGEDEEEEEEEADEIDMLLQLAADNLNQIDMRKAQREAASAVAIQEDVDVLPEHRKFRRGLLEMVAMAEAHRPCASLPIGDQYDSMRPTKKEISIMPTGSSAILGGGTDISRVDMSNRPKDERMFHFRCRTAFFSHPAPETTIRQAQAGGQVYRNPRIYMWAFARQADRIGHIQLEQIAHGTAIRKAAGELAEKLGGETELMLRMPRAESGEYEPWTRPPGYLLGEVELCTEQRGSAGPELVWNLRRIIEFRAAA